MSDLTSLFQEVSQDKLFVKVADKIQSLVVSQTLGIGDKLPAERELANLLGVSRTVVREALQVLRERGLVEVVSGSGTFVADWGLATERIQSSIGLVFQLESRSCDHLHEIRESLEIDIAGLAAERANPRQIERLQGAVDVMDQAIDSAEGFVKADLEFHSVLAEATQNPMFPALVSSIVDLLHDARLCIFQSQGAPARGQAGHKAILQCVKAGDIEGAQEAMRMHLRVSLADLKDGMAKRDSIR
jgi:GntR family transcriptional repressor for pyruvate dehydrogenase complex